MFVTPDCSAQEEVEVEVEIAIKWMEEGVGLVVVVLAEQMVKMAMNENTIDQRQMASTNKEPDKREQRPAPVNADQETSRIFQNK